MHNISEIARICSMHENMQVHRKHSPTDYDSGTPDTVRSLVLDESPRWRDTQNEDGIHLFTEKCRITLISGVQLIVSNADEMKIVFESAIMSLMKPKFSDPGTRICES